MLFSRWHAEHATPSSIEVGPCCRIADAMVIQTYVVPVHSGPPEEPPVVRPRGHGAARSTKDEGDDEKQGGGVVGSTRRWRLKSSTLIPAAVSCESSTSNR